MFLSIYKKKNFFFENLQTGKISPKCKLYSLVVIEKLKINLIPSFMLSEYPLITPVWCFKNSRDLRIARGLRKRTNIPLHTAKFPVSSVSQDVIPRACGRREGNSKQKQLLTREDGTVACKGSFASLAAAVFHIRH